MKLKTELEFMEMDDRMVAIPSGDNADDFPSMMRVNKTAMDILNLLAEETTEESVIAAMQQKYEGDGIAEAVHTYIMQLKAAGLVTE